MSIRYLINKDGTPFDPSELELIRAELDSLLESDREQYRNENAEAILDHAAPKMLIVSGPGTGKSYLFMGQIARWVKDQPEARVLVTSFVRKLVADLQTDIDNDQTLTEEQKRGTTASTLHKLARAFVEKNHGTADWPFKSHFRIIGQQWKNIVWADVQAFYPELDTNNYDWKQFAEQLHNDSFSDSGEWEELKRQYFEICKFYNAAGFADLIIRARVALQENPDLNENEYFIIDEYQDFNAAEEDFIVQLTESVKALLIVGDDEQVLYERLKCGQAALIRNHYKDQTITNAMLPFSSRCGYHITKSASHFLQQYGDEERIEKIFLPLESTPANPKVQVIACATPVTAVDYIAKFVKDHEQELDERKTRLSEGEEKDPFLLILTPTREVKFFANASETIFEIVAAYQTEARAFSEDYYKVLNYYSLAQYQRNNFTFRKVLFYEGMNIETVHPYLKKAIENGQDLCDLPDPEIKEILSKCDAIRAIVEEEIPLEEQIAKMGKYLHFADKERLKWDLEQQKIGLDGVTKLEHEEEEEAELEEIEIKRMSAVELITLVGAKGLSADHVIIIGCDDVNMSRITKNAFYVALTRARKSVHLLTALKAGGATKAHNFLQQIPEANAEFYKYTKANHSKTSLNSKTGFNRYLNFIARFSTRR